MVSVLASIPPPRHTSAGVKCLNKEKTVPALPASRAKKRIRAKRGGGGCVAVAVRGSEGVAVGVEVIPGCGVRFLIMELVAGLAEWNPMVTGNRRTQDHV